MARPRKEGMDYFPHDTDASTDKKIEALRAIYGNDGYAFYFILLEQIYQEPTFELIISDAETREEMIQILASKIAVTKERFSQILNTAIKWNCFDKELYEQKGILTSNGIKKRAGVVLEKRQKMRDKYQQDKDGISDAETTQETEEETPQSKVKKSKSKVKKYTPESQEYILAEYFLKKIRENNPTQKQPNIHKWSDDIDKILRIDGRPLEDVRETINFAQKSEFWRGNILSPAKLRKHFDQLTIQSKQVFNKNVNKAEWKSGITVPLGSEVEEWN